MKSKVQILRFLLGGAELLMCILFINLIWSSSIELIFIVHLIAVEYYLPTFLPVWRVKKELQSLENLYNFQIMNFNFVLKRSTESQENYKDFDTFFLELVKYNRLSDTSKSCIVHFSLLDY